MPALVLGGVWAESSVGSDLPRTTLVDSEVSVVLGSRKVIRSFFAASLTREPLKPTRETPTITVKRENHLGGWSVGGDENRIVGEGTELV